MMQSRIALSVCQFSLTAALLVAFVTRITNQRLAVLDQMRGHQRAEVHHEAQTLVRVPHRSPLGQPAPSVVWTPSTSPSVWLTVIWVRPVV